MAELMLVNPRKRKKRGTKKKTMATRKRRTAAQKRATKKLVAFNRARSRSRSNPAKRKTPRRKKVAVNARSRRTGRPPTARLKRRRFNNNKPGYYPNPRRRSTKGMVANIVDRQLKPAAIQASGAIGLDVIYGYFGNFIPAQLNSGMLRHVTKGVVALGMGFVVSNFMKNATANEMSKGALTVVMHDAFKEALSQWMPTIPLGDVGYYNASPVYQPQSQDMNMGYFQSQTGAGYSNDALGYFSQDTGAGYATVKRAEADLFDSADI